MLSSILIMPLTILLPLTSILETYYPGKVGDTILDSVFMILTLLGIFGFFAWIILIFVTFIRQIFTILTKEKDNIK